MNRRNFLKMAALALAGEGVRRTFPFRVYSFPKQIIQPRQVGWIFETTPIGSDPSWVKKLFLDPDCQPGHMYGIRASDLDTATSGEFMNISRARYRPIPGSALWPVEEVSLDEMRRRYPVIENPYLPEDYKRTLEGICLHREPISRKIEGAWRGSNA